MAFSIDYVVVYYHRLYKVAVDFTGKANMLVAVAVGCRKVIVICPLKINRQCVNPNIYLWDQPARSVVHKCNSLSLCVCVKQLVAKPMATIEEFRVI